MKSANPNIVFAEAEVALHDYNLLEFYDGVSEFRCSRKPSPAKSQVPTQAFVAGVVHIRTSGGKVIELTDLTNDSKIADLIDELRKKNEPTAHRSFDASI